MTFPVFPFPHPLKIVSDARGSHGVIPLGHGLMTIMPVMGTAIINTYRLLKNSKGAVSLAPKAQAETLDAGIRATNAAELRYIDWLSCSPPTITTARQILGIDHLSTADLSRAYDAAVARNNCPAAWVEHMARYLSRNIEQ